MTKPHKCPVCSGSGLVQESLYQETPISVRRLCCKSCSGTGILWEPEAYPTRLNDVDPVLRVLMVQNSCTPLS